MLDNVLSAGIFQIATLNAVAAHVSPHESNFFIACGSTSLSQHQNMCVTTLCKGRLWANWIDSPTRVRCPPALSVNSSLKFVAPPTPNLKWTKATALIPDEARLQQHTRLTKAIIHDTCKGKSFITAACDKKRHHLWNFGIKPDYTWPKQNLGSLRPHACGESGPDFQPLLEVIAMFKNISDLLPQGHPSIIWAWLNIKHTEYTYPWDVGNFMEHWLSTVKIGWPKSVDHDLHHSNLREPPSRRTKMGSTEHEINNVKRNLLHGVVATCSSIFGSLWN